jgi:DNA-binding NtrC family response regulator
MTNADLKLPLLKEQCLHDISNAWATAPKYGGCPLEWVEGVILLSAYQHFNHNTTKTALALKMNRGTLHKKLNRAKWRRDKFL